MTIEYEVLRHQTSQTESWYYTFLYCSYPDSARIRQQTILYQGTILDDATFAAETRLKAIKEDKNTELNPQIFFIHVVGVDFVNSRSDIIYTWTNVRKEKKICIAPKKEAKHKKPSPLFTLE